MTDVLGLMLYSVSTGRPVTGPGPIPCSSLGTRCLFKTFHYLPHSKNIVMDTRMGKFMETERVVIARGWGEGTKGGDII